jgi:hypothetical protein
MRKYKCMDKTARGNLFAMRFAPFAMKQSNCTGLKDKRQKKESQIAQKIERHHQIQHKKRAKKRENAITRKTRENARAGPPYGTGLHSLSHRCNNEIIGSTLPVW